VSQPRLSYIVMPRAICASEKPIAFSLAASADAL